MYTHIKVMEADTRLTLRLNSDSASDGDGDLGLLIAGSRASV